MARHLFDVDYLMYNGLDLLNGVISRHGLSENAEFRIT